MVKKDNTIYRGIDIRIVSQEVQAAILRAGKEKFLPSFPVIKELCKTHDLYHYTSIEALFNGILIRDAESDDKAISLFATHYQYLNDITELKYGEDMAREIFTDSHPQILNMEKPCKETDPLPIHKEFFIISFSKLGDSLPMWSMYGRGGNGIALEFDSYEVLQSLRYLYPCLYSKDDATKMIERVYDNMKGSKTLANNTAALASDIFILKHFMQVIKNPAYKYEEEVRFINEYNENIEYRYTNNLIIPYVKQYLPKKALKRIIIGPNLDKDRTRTSIERYIRSLGFEDVEVVSSDVPFRN